MVFPVKSRKIEGMTGGGDEGKTFLFFSFLYLLSPYSARLCVPCGQTFLSNTFTNSLNMQKQYEKKNVWETSKDTYSLSIRVQTTINHISISICLLPQYQRQRKCFSSERKLKKALRHTLTRAA